MIKLKKPELRRIVGHNAARIGNITRNARDRFLRTESMVVAGQLTYDVVHQHGLASVRHYHRLTEDSIQLESGESLPVSKTVHAIPLVIVAPLAVNMLIYDLFPQRSFIKYLLAKGFDVYLIDWGKPGLKHASQTLATYANELVPSCVEAAHKHSGAKEISLHGWSMGGGLAAIHAATAGKAYVRNLIMLGTPIDAHANGAMGTYFKQLGRAMRTMRLNLRKLPAQLAYAPGWVNVLGFKLMDPVSSIRGYLNLATQLENREYVEQHANQAAFIDNLEAYPGGVIRDWMCSVWLENETAKGRFTVGHDIVHLDKVTANLLCIAGKKDNLTNVPCAKGIMSVVSSVDKEFFIGPGGHIGIMGGRESLATIWPKTAEWLAARSGR